MCRTETSERILISNLLLANTFVFYHKVVSGMIYSFLKLINCYVESNKVYIMTLKLCVK